MSIELYPLAALNRAGSRVDGAVTFCGAIWRGTQGALSLATLNEGRCDLERLSRLPDRIEPSLSRENHSLAEVREDLNQPGRSSPAERGNVAPPPAAALSFRQKLLHRIRL
jgi:hypothetical protein